MKLLYLFTSLGGGGGGGGGQWGGMGAWLYTLLVPFVCTVCIILCVSVCVHAF